MIFSYIKRKVKKIKDQKYIIVYPVILSIYLYLPLYYLIYQVMIKFIVWYFAAYDDIYLYSLVVLFA